jgi:BirA family biotin operon repressor/biotin-[acetyl-CoA-carboxylase] ligase
MLDANSDTTSDTINDATNDVDEGCVVYADFQTCGRGQQGTHWESEQGANLLFSLLLRPRKLSVEHLFDLSRVVALGVAIFLKEKHIDARIKWANDIYVGDKKIAGILIEPSIRDGNVRYAIVGVGFNVNQVSFATARAISMASLLGAQQDRDECLSGLLDMVARYYARLQCHDYAALRNAYAALLYRSSGLHRYRAGDAVFAASMMGVSDDGCLLLQKEDGTRLRFRVKEVEFVVE